MATVHTFFPISRTMGNLTFYRMDGKNYVRKKSSLSARKVKTHTAFARTRYYANLMATASKIGSALYQALPIRWRQSWMYRSFTGEALKLLKAGKTIEEATLLLHQLYVEPVANRPVHSEAVVRPTRRYQKKHPAYWKTKSLKAQKRQSQKEKLRYHAGLLARASTIASKIYSELPANQRKHYVYKKITGWVMQFLKEEKEDATAILQEPAILIQLLPMILSISNTG